MKSLKCDVYEKDDVLFIERRLRNAEFKLLEAIGYLHDIEDVYPDCDENIGRMRCGIFDIRLDMQIYRKAQEKQMKQEENNEVSKV